MRHFRLPVPAWCMPVLCYCILVSAAQAYANSTQDVIRQQQLLQQREEQRRQELLRQHRESLEKPPAELEVNPLQKLEEEAEARCFEIRDIVLQGATRLSASTQKALLAPYRNQCLSLTDINNLLRDVTNAYIDAGFTTTRAAVPQQDLTSGVLTVLVIEGRVENIEFETPTSYAERKLRLAFPGITEDVLNIRNIEQGLDQLNRLPSNDATAEFIPGEAQGTTKVVIKNQPEKTWRVSAGLDNSGQESTGELKYTVGFEKDNLLESNDLLTLNYTADYDSLARNEAQRSQSLSALYSFGIGHWTFTGSWSNFDYRTTLTGSTIDLTSKGTTTTTNLAADYMFYRDADRKSIIGAGFTVRDTANYIEDLKLDASSQVLSIADVSLTHIERIAGGVLTARGSYHRGLPLFGAERDRSDFSKSTPKSEFDKFALDASYYRPFKLGRNTLSWSTRIWGQWSEDTLFSAERASVGGRYSVRGFHEDSLSGDIGGFTRNELTLAIPMQNKKTHAEKLLQEVQLFAGYDAGVIWKDPKDPFERGTVQGGAVGLRTVADNLRLELMLSKPLDSPTFLEKEDLDVAASVKIFF